MARFKRRTARRAGRSSIRRFGRSRRGNGSLVKPIMLDAMAYGALRERMSSALVPLTSKIPLGTVADEVGMGILNYFVAKKASGMIRDIALKGLVIENARLGEAVVSGNIFSTGGAATSDQYLY